MGSASPRLGRFRRRRGGRARSDPLPTGRRGLRDAVLPRRAGTYAEYVAVPSRQLAHRPLGVDHVHAAALPLVGLTAWHSLVDTAAVQPGQRVLIHGGGGGVGHLAIQIAKPRGAHVLTTTSAPKHDFVRGLGADDVIDYRTVDFVDVAHDVDAVLDTVGGYGERSLRALRPGGLLMTVVERADAALAARTEAAGMRFTGITVEHVLRLAEAAKAHELIESGRTQGKIVLTV